MSRHDDENIHFGADRSFFPKHIKRARPSGLTPENSCICRICGQRKFNDDMHNQQRCLDCWSSAEEQKRAKYWQEQQVNAINKVQHSAIRANSAPHIDTLCSAMIEKLGGLEGFVASWIGALEAARAEKPGGKLVLDTYRAIAGLVRIASENRLPEAPLEDLTEADLEREMANILTLEQAPEKDSA